MLSKSGVDTYMSEKRKRPGAKEVLKFECWKNIEQSQYNSQSLNKLQIHHYHQSTKMSGGSYDEWHKAPLRDN